VRQYVANQLMDFNSFDLGILREIIKSMAVITPPPPRGHSQYHLF